MKSVAALQALVVLLLVASAASCEVAREYSTRVFKPTVPQKNTDSTSIALKFMEFDSGNASDSINLKEFFTKDAKESEERGITRDTTRSETVIVENKNILKEPPTDASKRNTTRSKRVRQ